MNLSFAFLQHISIRCIICSILMTTIISGSYGHRIAEFHCQESLLRLSCPANHKLLLIDANYGRRFDSSTNVTCAGYVTSLPDCLWNQTMTVLNAKCRFRQHCELVHVNAFVFGGSPCNGVKYLDVIYDCIPDEEVYNICQDAILAEPHGYITSPGYPQDYPSRTKCSTTIEIDPGQYIVFTSHRMHMEADQEGTSCVDSVVLQDYNTTTTPLCQLPPGYQLISEAGDVIISMYSDGSVEKSGFVLEYSVLQYAFDDIIHSMWNASGSEDGVYRTRQEERVGFDLVPAGFPEITTTTHDHLHDKSHDHSNDNSHNHGHNSSNNNDINILAYVITVATYWISTCL